jgi:DNA-binding HxlR family transcriptional regulator
MKWNALADQSSSLCRALSVIGDRWTLLILNQCFLQLRRYGEIQSSLGLSRPLLAARLKKMVRLGVLKKVPSEVDAGSRISPDRKRPPALSRSAGPRSMGKCLGR